MSKTTVIFVSVAVLLLGAQSCFLRKAEESSESVQTPQETVSGPEAGKNTDPSTEQQSDGEQQNRPAITLGPQDGNTPQANSATSSAESNTDGKDSGSTESASIRARTREFLVSSRPGEGFLPEDFDIGRLADRYSDDSDHRSIYQTVDTFFQTIAKGTVPTETIMPAARTSVRRTLDFALTQGTIPSRWAVGAIAVSADSAILNVTLEGDPGRTAGELSLTSDGTSWYVTDVQIDFSQLAIATSEDRQFQPVSYDWQIHSR